MPKTELKLDEKLNKFSYFILTQQFFNFEIVFISEIYNFAVSFEVSKIIRPLVLNKIKS